MKKIENERRDCMEVYHKCHSEYIHELESLNSQRQVLLEQLKVVDNKIVKMNQSILDLDSKHESTIATYNTKLHQLQHNTHGSTSSSGGINNNSNSIFSNNIHVQNILHTVNSLEHQFADVLISQLVSFNSSSNNIGVIGDTEMKSNSKDSSTIKVVTTNVHCISCAICIYYIAIFDVTYDLIIIIIINSIIIIIVIIINIILFLCHSIGA